MIKSDFIVILYYIADISLKSLWLWFHLSRSPEGTILYYIADISLKSLWLWFHLSRSPEGKGQAVSCQMNPRMTSLVPIAMFNSYKVIFHRFIDMGQNRHNNKANWIAIVQVRLSFASVLSGLKDTDRCTTIIQRAQGNLGWIVLCLPFLILMRPAGV